MSENSDKGVVVVTGAASGMGEDATLYLNKLGYTVVAGVRRDSDGERLKEQAKRPDELHYVPLEVTDIEQVASAVNFVSDLLGLERRLVGIFSNAGIAAFSGDVSCEGCPIDTQEHVMEINHFGAVRVIQSFLPLLRASRGTVVVNSALMAHTVLPFNAGYAASKAALEAWSTSLRREVRPFGVDVVIIRAAAITTSLDSKQDTSKVPLDTPYPDQRALLESSFKKKAKRADDAVCSPRRVSELVVKRLRMNIPARNI